MSLSTSFPPTITSKVSAKKSMFSNLARMVSTGRSVGSRGKRARRGAQPGFGGRQPGTKPKRRSLGAGGEPQRSGPGSSTQDAGSLHDGLPGHQSSFTAPRCPTATVADPFPDTAAEEDRAGVGTLLCRTAGEEREALCAELTQSGPAHALTPPPLRFCCRVINTAVSTSCPRAGLYRLGTVAILGPLTPCRVRCPPPPGY